MAAVALQPEPGWEVLDACAAPGNKTVHLAALTKGRGKIIAGELHKERVQRLKDTITLAGAARNTDGIDRLRKLQAFQEKALAHALSFPAVERVVYSTCSVHQIENEDVIKSILPLASSFGFQLETPFPQWARRGLPVVEGSEHLLRTDPAEDKEGFFIALFVRKSIIINHDEEKPVIRPSSSTTSEALYSEKSRISINRKKKPRKKYYKYFVYCPLAKLSKMWLHPLYLMRQI